MMVTCLTEIWRDSLIGGPNVGERFHLLKIAPTAAPIVGPTYHEVLALQNTTHTVKS